VIWLDGVKLNGVGDPGMRLILHQEMIELNIYVCVCILLSFNPVALLSIRREEL
jgi:hypothetical protein